MSAPQTVVRELTAADLHELVPLHEAAFAGYMHVRLGRRYVRRFLTWFLESAGPIALGAFTAEGQLVGYVIGATPAGLDQLQRAIRPAAIAGLAAHPRLITERGVRQAIRSRIARRRGLDRPDEGADADVHLVGIGVAQDARRAGIGDALMRAFHDTATRRGLRSAYLAVYPDNVAARKLYERAGWTASELTPGRSTIAYRRRLASSGAGNAASSSSGKTRTIGPAI